MAISNIKTNATSAGEPLTLGQYFQKLQPAPRSRDFRQARTPWMVSCRSWENDGAEPINLYCNPASVQWSVPRRGTSVKTAAGTIRSVYRNRFRNTYFDEAEVTMTFQAGNIMPFMAYYGTGTDFKNVEQVEGALVTGGIPPGLQDFYRFLALMDAPATLGAAENRHILVYRSRVFPKMYLEGFFKDDVPITWAERADDTGNSIEWTATFQIYMSFPHFGNFEQMRDTYQAWISAEGALEAMPMGSVTAQEYSNYKAQKVLAEADVDAWGSGPPKAGQLQTTGGKTTVVSPPGVTMPPPVPGSVFVGVQPGPYPPGSNPDGGAKAAGKVGSQTLLMLGGGDDPPPSGPTGSTPRSQSRGPI